MFFGVCEMQIPLGDKFCECYWSSFKDERSSHGRKVKGQQQGWIHQHELGGQEEPGSSLHLGTFLFCNLRKTPWCSVNSLGEVKLW